MPHCELSSRLRERVPCLEAVLHALEAGIAPKPRWHRDRELDRALAEQRVVDPRGWTD